MKETSKSTSGLQNLFEIVFKDSDNQTQNLVISAPNSKDRAVFDKMREEMKKVKRQVMLEKIEKEKKKSSKKLKKEH